jgi:hypothetical protein
VPKVKLPGHVHANALTHDAGQYAWQTLLVGITHRRARHTLQSWTCAASGAPCQVVRKMPLCSSRRPIKKETCNITATSTFDSMAHLQEADLQYATFCFCLIQNADGTLCTPFHSQNISGLVSPTGTHQVRSRRHLLESTTCSRRGIHTAHVTCVVAEWLPG